MQETETPGRDVNRTLRVELFLGSTIEAVGSQLHGFLEQHNICVGNYVDLKLHKLGNLYQLALVYAKLI